MWPCSTVGKFTTARAKKIDALVTETYSPEINGVAMTLGHLVDGLARRGHQVTVVRPRAPRPLSTCAAGLRALPQLVAGRTTTTHAPRRV